MADTTEYPIGAQVRNPGTGQVAEWTASGWKIVAGAGPAASKPVNALAPGASYFSNSGVAPKLAPADMSSLKAYRDAAESGSGMRADANRFVELNKSTRTGGIESLPVIGNALAMVDPKRREMMSLSDKIAPAMRQAGSGAMSDKDVEMYKSATVGTNKLGPTNQAIGGVIDAGTRRQADYSAFMEEWARRNGGLIGAREAWDSYANDNPLFDTGPKGTVVRKTQPWRQWFGLEGGAAPKPAAKPGSREPAAMTDADLKAALGL